MEQTSFFFLHVPDRDVVQEGPVLGDRVVEVGREEHVVVDVVRRAAGPTGGVEERRTPVPRSEVDRRALLEHLLPFVHHSGHDPLRSAGRSAVDGLNHRSNAGRPQAAQRRATARRD